MSERGQATGRRIFGRQLPLKHSEQSIGLRESSRRQDGKTGRGRIAAVARVEGDAGVESAFPIGHALVRQGHGDETGAVHDVPCRRRARILHQIWLAVMPVLRRMVKVERAVAVAVVVDDQAGVGNPRGNVPHHHVSRGHIDERDGRGHARRDGDVSIGAVGDETEAVGTACRNHRLDPR